jgi:hypothetical protein
MLCYVLGPVSIPNLLNMAASCTCLKHLIKQFFLRRLTLLHAPCLEVCTIQGPLSSAEGGCSPNCKMHAVPTPQDKEDWINAVGRAIVKHSRR